MHVSSVTQSCPTFCSPIDCSPSDSSVHGIFQSRILEWVDISYSWESSRLRDRTHVPCDSCIARRFFTAEPPGLPPLSPMKWSEVAQSCPTLCDPMDCSPPGSSVHGIFQAWILEWVAISFSRGSSWPRDQTLISYISCIGRQVIYH